MLVLGRLGGAVTVLLFDPLLFIVSGAENPPAAGGVDTMSLCPGTSEEAEGTLFVAGAPILGADVGPRPGLPELLAVRGGPAPRGGGGVADRAGAFSAPPFLLTQRLSSGS